MHPGQMRETVIPVLPNFEYCIISPNCFFRFSPASEFRARTAKTPVLARGCQGRIEIRSDCDGRQIHLVECETRLGFTLPWAAAAAPAPAGRRRANLRSASFRDYAMAGVTPAPNVKAALRCRARALPAA